MLEIVIVVVLLIVAVALWATAKTKKRGTHACALCNRSFNSARDLEAHLLEHGRIERPTLTPP